MNISVTRHQEDDGWYQSEIAIPSVILWRRVPLDQLMDSLSGIGRFPTVTPGKISFETRGDDTGSIRISAKTGMFADLVAISVLLTIQDAIRHFFEEYENCELDIEVLTTEWKPGNTFIPLPSNFA